MQKRFEHNNLYSLNWLKHVSFTYGRYATKVENWNPEIKNIHDMVKLVSDLVSDEILLLSKNTLWF